MMHKIKKTIATKMKMITMKIKKTKRRIRVLVDIHLFADVLMSCSRRKIRLKAIIDIELSGNIEIEGRGFFYIKTRKIHVVIGGRYGNDYI